MKKRILLLLVITLFLFGCGKKEEDHFTHYDLKDYDLTNTHVYYNQDNQREEYILTDITPEHNEYNITGLFYKIEESDYILLETFEPSSRNSYTYNSEFQFYENKLYGISNHQLYEVKLEGKNSKKQLINFTLDEESIPMMGVSIKMINDEKITISSTIFMENHSVLKTLQCSLETYKCNIIEE